MGVGWGGVEDLYNQPSMMKVVWSVSGLYMADECFPQTLLTWLDTDDIINTVPVLTMKQVNQPI